MGTCISDQCFHQEETNQLICSANQLTGFYAMETFVVNGLTRSTIGRMFCNEQFIFLTLEIG